MLAPGLRADGLYPALHTRVPTANCKTSANTVATRATCRHSSWRWRWGRAVSRLQGAVIPSGVQKDCVSSTGAPARPEKTPLPAHQIPIRQPWLRFVHESLDTRAAAAASPFKAFLCFSTKNSIYGPTQHRAEGRTLVGDGLWQVGNSSTSELPVELSEVLILGLRSQKF